MYFRALLHRLNNALNRRRKPEGVKGVEKLGHRAYVGGKWEEIGRLQLEFLRDEGLEPHHTLLDIGCGSLRAGVHFIRFLEPDHYWGLEKHEALIQCGIEDELSRGLLEEKRPRFIVSDEFEFQRVEGTADWAVAMSVFTHLPLSMIRLCLSRLRPIMPEGRLLATFFEAKQPVGNPSKGHDHINFLYTIGQMTKVSRDTGWNLEYIGDWGHPRGQAMLRFSPDEASPAAKSDGSCGRE